MMKRLITVIFVVLAQVGWSQVKVSVADGDWYNPQTWSPAGAPQFNEDTVLVNHEIDGNFSQDLGINHLIIGTSGILNASGTFALHGSLKVEGEFYADSLIIGDGDYFINNGLIEANMFVTTNLLNENFGYIDMLGTMSNVEPFLNAAGAVIETVDLITTSDADFENNGSVYSNGWLNEGTVFGTGSFCVEGCLQNVGDITGTLDVCDATPNGGMTCDFNFGTIAPTVTFCANGSCSGSAGIVGSSIIAEIKVFPNPSSDGRFTIETDAAITNMKVIDLTGRLLVEKSTGDLNFMDVSFLESGEYLLVFETEQDVVTKRIVKSN